MAKYYRSLAELERSPAFEEFLHREFPQAASELPDGLSRRRWIQLMGAALALSGAVGCRRETETIAPAAARAPNQTPGEAKHFNTTIELADRAAMLRSTHRDGRPIKLDGNPLSRTSGSSAQTQALLLELYDPERCDIPTENARGGRFERTWEEALDALAECFHGNGEGAWILSRRSTSPSVKRLETALREKLPQVRWCRYTSADESNVIRGSTIAFGRPLRTHLHLSKAKVVVAIDANLLGDHPESLKHANAFAQGREPGPEMNRLYAIESELTTTGAAADHRLALPSHQIGDFLSAIDDALARDTPVHLPENDSFAEKVFAAIVDDLRRNQGQAIVAVGAKQPPEVHALAHRIHDRLQCVGATVTYTTENEPEDASSLADLRDAINSKRCHTLLILEGNPAYDAPVDLDFAASLDKVDHKFHLTLYENETSLLCDWILPQSHPLECWSDTLCHDGTHGIGQPLIEPLHDSRSALALLRHLAGVSGTDQHYVRRTAVASFKTLEREKGWRRAVHDGFIADSAHPPSQPTLQSFHLTPTESDWRLSGQPANGELELNFSFSGSVFDGRFANNAWLQELPHPMTKLTWGNAVVMSPATAAVLSVKDHEVVALELDGRVIEAPVYIQPGQAEGSVSIAMGYGRTHAGAVGGDTRTGVEPIGVDAGRLRTTANMHFATGLTIAKTGRKQMLASTQDHYAIDKVGLEAIAERIGDLVREGDLSEFEKHPDFAQHRTHHPPLESLWTEPSYDDLAWGMSIDLNKCIGCNSCMVACQAENNVPVVGREQVQLNREMHWIRVDRYFAGDPEQPEVVHQPVACHHCENAPCEQVCPVAATVHSDEGLNDMAYNRCIGTRYCANNCPYKVRRFNFLDYRREQPATDSDLSHLILNPEVTVRSRGVMEKCTYCVQRIQNAKITAKNERRPLGADEVVTACQQACPSQAIEFGDLNRADSKVAQAHADPRAYGMLSELNVKPRTKYLARIRNRHPWLGSDSHSETGAHEAERLG